MGVVRLGLAVGLLLLVILAAVAQREYEGAYARRHRDIPSIFAPFSRPDPDPGVDWFRRRVLALDIATIVLAIILVVSLTAQG